MNPGKEVVNIITCHEEVGSGTVDAAGGKFFSAEEPLPGSLYNNSGIKYIRPSDPVPGLADNAKVMAIMAREPTGEVIDPTPAIETALKKIESNNYQSKYDTKRKQAVPIVHQVYGSKTGIIQEFNADLNKKTQEMGGFIVVDACQGRFDKSMLQNLIGNNAITLFTGSKFFRGPPFSGAVIVPPEMMAKL